MGVRLGPAGGVNLTGGGLTNNCGSSSDVLNLTMTYGSAGANNGNLTGEGFAAPLSTSETFSYDAYNRIGLAYEGPNQGSNCTSWSQTYNYDAYGNRWVTAPCGFTLYQFTPESDAYTSNNQLPNTFNGAGYDNNGNQTAMGLFSFTYDAENRQYTSSIGGTVTQYTYDGEGRRVMKTTGDTQTVYVYDADGQVASEYSNVTPPYVGTLYLTGDHLGSTRAETNSAGAAQWYHDYLPFGEELLSGIGGRGSLYGPGDVDGTTHKFTSKERDAETGGSAAQGLDYFGARYFSAAQGRFTSPDWSATPQPIPYADLTDPQTLNLYSYVRNNPLSKTDPDGHCGIWGDSSCTFSQWVKSIPDRAVGGLKFEANAALEMVGVAPKFQASNAEQADAMAAGEQVKPLFQTGLAMAIPGPEGIKGEVVEPEVAPNFDAARTTAFEKAGMTNPADVQFSKVDPKTGTVVEFKGPNGAKVAYDTPHDSPGPGHDQPHVGWQTGGKRGAGGTERCNIPYEGPQHPSRPKVKGEGDIKQD